MSKLYRLDFQKNEPKFMGPSSVGYHPYFDGSKEATKRDLRDHEQTLGHNPWPFSVTLDVLVAGNQTRQGRCYERRNRAADLEKQRQSRINEAIGRLRQVLPHDYVHGERMTKAKTLRFAAAYIHELTSILQSSAIQGLTTDPRCTSGYMPSPPMNSAEDFRPPMSPYATPFNANAFMSDYPGSHRDPYSCSYAMNAPPMTSYGAPSPGPYPHYQQGHYFPPSTVPGTPPGRALRPLCTSSPIYARSRPTFGPLPPTATSPVVNPRPAHHQRTFFPDMTEQYFAYIPRISPQADSVRSPSQGSQVTIPSPLPQESDVITVESSDEEEF